MIMNARPKTENQNPPLAFTSLADVEIEVFAEMQRVSIIVQEPTVGHLEETVGVGVR